MTSGRLSFDGLMLAASCSLCHHAAVALAEGVMNAMAAETGRACGDRCRRWHGG
jgi:hypothetical protein